MFTSYLKYFFSVDYNKKGPFSKYLWFLSETFLIFLTFSKKKTAKNKHFTVFTVIFRNPVCWATIFPVIRTQKHVDMESLKKIGRWS